MKELDRIPGEVSNLTTITSEPMKAIAFNTKTSTGKRIVTKQCDVKTIPISDVSPTKRGRMKERFTLNNETVAAIAQEKDLRRCNGRETALDASMNRPEKYPEIRVTESAANEIREAPEKYPVRGCRQQ